MSLLSPLTEVLTFQTNQTAVSQMSLRKELIEELFNIDSPPPVSPDIVFRVNHATPSQTFLLFLILLVWLLCLPRR